MQLVNTKASSPAPAQKCGLTLLRVSLSIVFIWFGILKPFGLSPASDLVANTVFWFSSDWFVPLLGWWEVAIGVFLLFRKTLRMALVLLFLQLPGTFLPLIILPEVSFVEFPLCAVADRAVYYKKPDPDRRRYYRGKGLERQQSCC